MNNITNHFDSTDFIITTHTNCIIDIILRAHITSDKIDHMLIHRTTHNIFKGVKTP